MVTFSLKTVLMFLKTNLFPESFELSISVKACINISILPLMLLDTLLIHRMEFPLMFGEILFESVELLPFSHISPVCQLLCKFDMVRI